MTIFIRIIVIIVLFFILLHIWTKSRRLRKEIRRLQELPPFATDLLDCYVHFQGYIATPNQHTTPIYQKACAFYLSRIQAKWETKVKKPGKGMQTNTKTLHNESSPSSVIELMDAQGQEVFVDLKEFAPPLRTKSEIVEICPALCAEKVDPKYKKYDVLERWCASQDKVSIYGKLIRDEQGRLWLKHTGYESYPALFLISGQQGQHPKNQISLRQEEMPKAFGFMLVSLMLFICIASFFVV